MLLLNICILRRASEEDAEPHASTNRRAPCVQHLLRAQTCPVLSFPLARNPHV